MQRNEDNLITGPYEIELLRKIVEHHDTYGNINVADMRSLNYATKRLNIRAGMARMSPLNYPD